MSRSPDDDVVCEEARDVWACVYGAPRSSPAAPRLDTGKRKQENPSSEAGFLRRRRAAVAVGADGLDGGQCWQPAPRAVGADGWEASHEAEKDFQLAKRRVRLFECIEEGGALPEELEDGVHDELAAFRSLEAKRHCEYDAQRSRIARALAQPELPGLAGQVCFAPSALSDEVDRACRRMQIARHDDYISAQVYIVQDVCAPDVALLWPAMLAGSLVCDPEFIVSEGTRGTSLKYKAATQIARAMHITPNFAAAHPTKAPCLINGGRA